MDTKLHIVLAVHKENIDWAEQYSPIVIVKDKDVPNVGREPLSYMWYIIQNYNKLEGKYFFLQGDPRDHLPNYEEELSNTDGDFRWLGNRKGFRCDMMARPHDNVDIKSFLEEIGIKYPHEEITFNGCCLFMVSAERIKQRPKEFYQKVYDVLMKGERREYAFERCVGLIFGDKNDFR